MRNLSQRSRRIRRPRPVVRSRRRPQTIPHQPASRRPVALQILRRTGQNQLRPASPQNLSDPHPGSGIVEHAKISKLRANIPSPNQLPRNHRLPPPYRRNRLRPPLRRRAIPRSHASNSDFVPRGRKQSERPPSQYIAVVGPALKRNNPHLSFTANRGLPQRSRQTGDCLHFPPFGKWLAVPALPTATTRWRKPPGKPGTASISRLLGNGWLSPLCQPQSRWAGSAVSYSTL
jgi:hypothetical protein